jgi:energy-coupling factor transporter ATP-binding protein EcfA2
MNRPQPSSETRAGLFVTVDGPSGVGKTTTITHLAQLLKADNAAVHVTAEPSRGAIKRLAHNLTDTVTGPALACLYAADRYHHLQTETRPLLDAGHFGGSDDIVDDELVRYFTFVTQAAEWQNGSIAKGRLEPRAEVAFSAGNPRGPDNLDFLFDAFDAWEDVDIAAFFANLLTTDASQSAEKILLFGSKPIDYFRSCCENYAFGLTAALLATGDYSRRPNPRSLRFGSPEDDRWWRELLTGTKRSNLGTTSKVLAALLDSISDAAGDLSEALRQIREQWLEDQHAFDWRFYLVKYDAMREGKSGIYFAEGGSMGFRLCMLDKTQMNSWYRDPFLLAVWRATEVRDAVRYPVFMGYETDPRWMTLHASGARIRCITEGFLLMPPPDEAYQVAFATVCEAAGIGEDNLLRIPQEDRDGRPFDTLDRVELGAKLLTDLVSAGL